MPWPWKKADGHTTESAPQPGPSNPSEPVPGPIGLGPDEPLRGEFRFRVDDVYDITGIGCVAVGVALVGSTRFPAELRVLPGPGSPTPPASVRAVSAMARRKDAIEVLQGMDAGLALRGVARIAGIGRVHRWDLRKGDHLVSR